MDQYEAVKRVGSKYEAESWIIYTSSVLQYVIPTSQFLCEKSPAVAIEFANKYQLPAYTHCELLCNMII